MTEPRLAYRDLAIALGVLALVFAGLFIWAGWKPLESTPITAYTDSGVPKIVIETTEIEPADEARKPETIERYVVDSHVVVAGQSFSLITGIYWDDIFLWPDLYIQNSMRSPDPDLIFPDEVVDIYNRLGRGDDYTRVEKNLILDAYIQVYDQFKSLGPEKNASAWTLLWCGAKYDHDFLETYSHRIAPEDKAVAERYIAEEGFLD